MKTLKAIMFFIVAAVILGLIIGGIFGLGLGLIIGGEDGVNAGLFVGEIVGLGVTLILLMIFGLHATFKKLDPQLKKLDSHFDYHLKSNNK